MPLDLAEIRTETAKLSLNIHFSLQIFSDVRKQSWLNPFEW